MTSFGRHVLFTYIHSDPELTEMRPPLTNSYVITTPSQKLLFKKSLHKDLMFSLILAVHQNHLYHF